MSKKNELQIRDVKDLKYEIPNSDNINTKKVVTEIQNAWKYCILDEMGFIWIIAEKLHSILRTTKSNAKYYIQQIDKKDKYNFNGSLYIRGSAVIYILDKRLQSTGEIITSNNLKYSWEIYSKIRDCPEAQLIRNQYSELIKTYKKKLKKDRIKKLKIKKDELTGEDLDIKTSEFAHIRSYSIYKDISTNIFNGLIVNKSTHKKITQKKVNDENELFNLCVEYNWNIKWYKGYINTFGEL